MANKVPPQTIVASTDTDATTNYPEDFQNFPPLDGAQCVNITVNNIEQRIQNTFNTPQGQQFEVQFKNCAKFAGDSGLTYTLANKTLNANNLNVTGISALGNAACLRIDGGNPGDILTKFTNNGDVVWCNPNSLITSAVCVGTVDGSNNYTNVLSNVQRFAFDQDSGFDVSDLGAGTAKIAMNSTFKYWETDGNPGLTACGLDTVNFVAGSNVTITSDNTAVPKTLTISASAGGTPGGCNTQVQYNNGGTFTGACGLTYDNSTGGVGLTRIDVPTGQSLEINVNDTNAYWYSLYGDLTIDVGDDYGTSIDYDSAGNIYIIGADGNSGIPYIVKYDTLGAIVWQKTFTESNNYYKTGDALRIDDNDNIYCVVSIDAAIKNTTVFKFNSAGTLLWQTTITPSATVISFAGGDISIDGSGNVYLVTYTRTTLYQTLQIVKLNNAGVIQWQISQPDMPTAYFGTIKNDQFGNVYVSTEFLIPGNDVNSAIIKLDSSGNVLWQKNFDPDPSSLATNVPYFTLDSAGNLYVTGDIRVSNSPPARDIYIMKLDSSGNLVWQTNIENTDPYGWVMGIDLDSSNNVYINWYQNLGIGSRDLGIVKLDNSGSVVWSRAFGSSDTDRSYYYWGGNTLKVHNNKYAITGYTYGGGLSNAEAITVQLPTDGSLIGIYDNYQYKEITIVTNNVANTVYAGTDTFIAGTNLITSGSYSINTATNTNTLYKISGGSNTIEVNSSGNLKPGEYTLPILAGLNGQVLTTDGAGTTYWQTSTIVDVATPTTLGTVYACTTSTLNNTFVGHQAGLCNSTGTLNVAIGVSALSQPTCTFGNIAIGACAGYSGNSVYGIMIGNCAGQSGVDYGTVAIGHAAGQCITQLGEGPYNVLIGLSAGRCMNCGVFNTFVGACAGRRNLGCSVFNTAIGAYGMGCAGAGTNNVSVGSYTMETACDPSNGAPGACSNWGNNAVGNYVLYRNKGIGNNGFGYFALYDNTCGNHNQAVGFCALGNNTYGSCNIGIGMCAGSSITTGNNNTVIGSLPGTAGMVCTVLIGAGTCERVKIDNTGLYINGACWCSGGAAVSAATPTSLGTVYARTPTTCRNASLGYCASNASLTGYGNSAVGYGSLSGTTNGSLNTAFGAHAIASGNASLNTAIGACAMAFAATGSFNTAVGAEALRAIQGGNCNVAVGLSALWNNTAGCNNVALGTFALGGNLTGSNNIGIGPDSLCQNFCGQNNVAVGRYTLSYNLNANNNTALGTFSLFTASGSDNTAVGANAGINLTSGNTNILVGYCAGTCVTTGSNNTIIGKLQGSAGLVCTVLIGAGTCERIKVDNTGLCINGAPFTATVNLDAYCSFKIGNGLTSSTGINNLAIGCNVLNVNTTGASNIAIGMCTMAAMITGSFNIAIGCSTLRRNTAGIHNVALGYDALANNLVDGCNIAIGAQALTTHVSGVNNVAFGYRALGYGVSGSNNIAIGCASLLNNTTSNNIGIGLNAGIAITTGTNNTIIGTLSGAAGLVCTVLIGAGTCERIKVDNTGLYVNGSCWCSGGGGGSGTVTSVATSGSGLGFSLGGGPITTTGTVTLTVPTATNLSTCLQGDGLDGTSVGFRVLPQNSQSTNYTLVAADSGKHLLHPSTDANARTFTIPANGTVAYPIGTSITFINETSQVLTISITSDTMYLAGSGLTGSRTLGQYGVATAIKTGSTTWYISGTGLT